MKPPGTLSRFELVRKLGDGSFGTVWEAEDKKLDRRVALKILSRSRLSAEEIERFQQEARAAAKLDHPHIVPLFDVGTETDSNGEQIYYLVFKLIEGVTLSDWMGISELTNRRAAEICREVADAIGIAHRNDIVHRDLKPDNILIDLAGVPFVTDFGIAKMGNSRLTETNTVLGTLAYMSPEQVGGQVSPKSDVFAIGVILFELLSGQTPFDCNDPVQLLSRLCIDEAPSVSSVSTNTPIDLATICDKCRERKPQDRYDSADELRDDLDRFLRGEPVRARRVGPWERAKRRAERHVKLMAGLLAVSTLIIGVLIYAYVMANSATLYAESQQRRAENNTRKAMNQITGAAATAAKLLGQGADSTEISSAVIDRANEFFRTFTERNGEEPAVRLERGLGHMHLGNIALAQGDETSCQKQHLKARDVFQSLTVDYPANHVHWLELGQTQNIIGQRFSDAGNKELAKKWFNWAFASFEQTLKLDPSPHAENIAAWFLTTCPLHDFRDYNYAAQLAERAVKRAKYKAAYWNTLGVAQFRQENFSDALESFDKATQKDKSGKQGIGSNDVFRAMALWKLNRKEEARLIAKRVRSRGASSQDFLELCKELESVMNE